jgi:hypothetical protein
MNQRTFHHDRSELHGITVVVDTHGPQVWVGRCDDIDDAGVILLDADVHSDGEGGRSKQDYVQQAAAYGVWKKHARVVVPKAEVASIVRLGDVPAP